MAKRDVREILTFVFNYKLTGSGPALSQMYEIEFHNFMDVPLSF